MSLSFEPLLPPWRRLLQRLNWRPTIGLRVKQYALEQRLLQMQKEDELQSREDERIAVLDAKIAAPVRSSFSFSNSTQTKPAA